MGSNPTKNFSVDFFFFLPEVLSVGAHSNSSCLLVEGAHNKSDLQRALVHLSVAAPKKKKKGGGREKKAKGRICSEIELWAGRAGCLLEGDPRRV